ncbi:ankyrin repeat domain-containing protein [Owenweeksia hongkongensis]|uniref:ankyrin repeat domain-containing protein n=1 Tax=Owenweeksia hongkongensis TaxID=253245 RepID=UPI003A95AB74
MRGCFIAVALLLQAMAHGQNIFDVARTDDVASLGKMIKLNPDTVNSKNASGHTPLILAAYNNQVEMADKLIQSGADVNYTFSQGSAIHGAAFKGHFDVLKLLVENGADIDEPDQNKTTPLIYATLFGHTELAEYLYVNGADPNYSDATGSSAINYAESLNNEILLNTFKSQKE